MTAKVWCWKVKITYLCGCRVTGKTIHNCNSTGSNCNPCITRRTYNRECWECDLENQNGGRNLDNGDGLPSKVVAAPDQLEEAVEPGYDAILEPIEPVCYAESGRKVVTTG